MQVQDLGELQGPVLLFGGPYSNLPATRQLLKVAGDIGISPTQMICTGDVVAYCADPVETLAMIRDSGCAVVAGNCERQLAKRALDCGCGFAAGTVCDVLSAGWYGFCAGKIGQNDRTWMANLPDWISFQHDGARYVVVHGGASDIARMLWPVSPKAAFAAEFDRVTVEIGRVDAIICGHSGIAFQRQTAQGRWINAGVIGMPPNDGQPETRFAILDAGKLQFHRLSYPAQQARDAMQSAGLTQGYQRALTEGYWPSEEVLPPEMRAKG